MAQKTPLEIVSLTAKIVPSQTVWKNYKTALRTNFEQYVKNWKLFKKNRNSIAHMCGKMCLKLLRAARTDTVSPRRNLRGDAQLVKEVSIFCCHCEPACRRSQCAPSFLVFATAFPCPVSSPLLSLRGAQRRGNPHLQNLSIFINFVENETFWEADSHASVRTGSE